MDNINALIKKSNDQFEFLDFIEMFEMDNELISLKISIINLLDVFKKYDDNGNEMFFQIFILSTPVLFDFLYNDFVRKENRFLKSRYKKTKYYSQSKKWYKFIRNSIIHTNRYTHNQFTNKIYRIEYEESINILFELNKDNGAHSFDKFLNNHFANKNFESLAKKEISPLLINKDNVKISIDYDEFINFVYNEVKIFVDLFEREVDKLIMKQITNWEQYYIFYYNLIFRILKDKQLIVDDIIKLIELIKKFKHFNNHEVVILIEFLLFLLDNETEMTKKEIEEIVFITTIDIYSQISNRAELLSEIETVKVTVDYNVDNKKVINISKQLNIYNKELENFIKNTTYTNYLIIFTKKYLVNNNII